jgi:hypothetical protein
MNEVDCPKREVCYRYMAPDSQWQSYMNAPMVVSEGEFVQCEDYVPNEVRERL